MGRMLEARGLPAVVLDLDWLGWTYLGPGSPPPGEMIATNLAVIWPNFVAAGMRYAILARGLSSRAALESLERALPLTDIKVVRLAAAGSTLAARLRGRDTGAELGEHLRGAQEMSEIMERLQLEDFVVSGDAVAVEVVAAEVVRQLGW